MTRYLTLAEYFWLAEQVTGSEAAVLVKAARVELPDSTSPWTQKHLVDTADETEASST